MDRQQMDSRRDARRYVYRVFVVISLLGMAVGGPFEYLLGKWPITFYSSLSLLLLATLCCLVAEARDLIQRRVVED